MRRIFHASFAVAVLMSAGVVSPPIAAQQAPADNVPAQSDQTGFVQKTFIIATFIDPRTDLGAFSLAKEAHFNLLTGTALNGGAFQTGEMDNRLGLADQAGLMSLVSDPRARARSPFNPSAALAVTNHYTNLDDARRSAMYGLQFRGRAV